MLPVLFLAAWRACLLCWTKEGTIGGRDVLGWPGFDWENLLNVRLRLALFSWPAVRCFAPSVDVIDMLVSSVLRVDV